MCVADNGGNGVGVVIIRRNQDLENRSFDPQHGSTN